jgi:tRNA threonylcarbamoyladenosine biosynthesis protein TsaB
MAELRFRHRLELSRYLAPRIQEVLTLAALAISDLEGIAVSVGPGSFTGLRIGVTAAKALAFAGGLPVAGVGTLEALAWEHPAPPGALLCAVVSASPEQVFAALYQWGSEGPSVRAEETLLPAADLAAKLAQTPLEVVMVGQPGCHRETLAQSMGPRLAGPAEDAPPRAGTVAVLGRQRLLEGGGDSVHALAPRYLRLSTAETRLREAACPPS